MNDLISRQAAEDAMTQSICGDTWEVEKAMEAVMQLPAADVTPVVHGKWKKIGVWGRVYRCNQCGNFLDFDAVNAGRGDANFCPNCGADMREDNNGGSD